MAKAPFGIVNGPAIFPNKFVYRRTIIGIAGAIFGIHQGMDVLANQFGLAIAKNGCNCWADHHANTVTVGQHQHVQRKIDHLL